MNIKKLEDVLDEMRKARFADEATLRSWEQRIGEAITDDLLGRIEASVVSPTLATEPGGYDWE
jgi:hypothetical protein